MDSADENMDTTVQLPDDEDTRSYKSGNKTPSGMFKNKSSYKTPKANNDYSSGHKLIPGESTTYLKSLI